MASLLPCLGQQLPCTASSAGTWDGAAARADALLSSGTEQTVAGCGASLLHGRVLNIPPLQELLEAAGEPHAEPWRCRWRHGAEEALGATCRGSEGAGERAAAGTALGSATSTPVPGRPQGSFGMQGKRQTSPKAELGKAAALRCSEAQQRSGDPAGPTDPPGTGGGRSGL